MSDGPCLNKKELIKSYPTGIKSNGNILNGLYEIKEICPYRPTTAAEKITGKPPKNPKKQLQNVDMARADATLITKQKFTLSNPIIISKDNESKLNNPISSLPKKAGFSPISTRPVTYNPTALNFPRKANPRTLSLVKKTEDEVINDSLPNYIIKKVLGKGAYATVRLAQHIDSKKKVAIKTYEKYQILDPQKKTNMLREIEILKKLDHPNIIKLYETLETPKYYHLILEYVPGISLYSYLKSKPNRTLDESEAKRLFKQVLSALDYCHSNNVAHRDIKLDNIILDLRNNVKIIDFGFSTMHSQDVKSRIFCGTPSYMAPEIVGRKDYYGTQADIWALGILLYAMICGKMPFKAYNDKELYRRIEKGAFSVPSTFQDSLKALINKILETNPKKRPSIKELLEDEWVSCSGVLRTTAQPFPLKVSNDNGSLDLDIISGIVIYK
jgi:tRNA A-37 threonylcarbamoyl transferase component Bud32